MRRPLIFIAGLAGVVVVLFLVWYALMYDRTMEHGDRMALDAEVAKAVDAQGRPDYAREIEIYRTRLPEGDDRALSIATATLSACANKMPPCVANPVATRAEARAQLAALETNASDPDIRSMAKDWLAR